MRASVLLFLLLLSCDGWRLSTPNSKQETVVAPARTAFASARTPFDKKRVCAEEGKKYFTELKLDHGTLPEENFQVTGPLFAYNASFDTCLCEYFVFERNLRTRTGYDAGYIDDIFQNAPVATFHITRNADGTTSSEGMMSKEAFEKRERELMRFY